MTTPDTTTTVSDTSKPPLEGGFERVELSLDVPCVYNHYATQADYYLPILATQVSPNFVVHGMLLANRRQSDGEFIVTHLPSLCAIGFIGREGRKAKQMVFNTFEDAAGFASELEKLGNWDFTVWNNAGRDNLLAAKGYTAVQFQRKLISLCYEYGGEIRHAGI
jgi:hypothetical protein